MQFRIDLKIFLFILLFYLTKQIEVYTLTMLFAFIHELGHLLAGIILGMKPKKLEIVPYGVRISFELFPKDYNIKIQKGNLLEIKKIIVALAGPITNILILIIALYINTNIVSQFIIVYINILLIIFNLIPIYPLDGGRMIKSMLHIKYGKMQAEKKINKLSFITLVILTIFASILIYATENIAVFFITIILWALYIKEDLIYRKREKIYNLLQKSVEI